jgi:hypothetical protein
VKIDVSLKGADRVQARLQQLLREYPDAGRAGLYAEAEVIMTRSKTEFVPVDDGILRSTGHVKPPVTEGNETTITLGFGGPAAPYAVVQHERLDYQHTVGQAKYLEQPAVEAARGLSARLAAFIRQAIRR